jgi:hypothetical protein
MMWNLGVCMIIAGNLQPCFSTKYVLDGIVSPEAIVGMRSSCTNIDVYTLLLAPTPDSHTRVESISHDIYTLSFLS